VRLGDLGLETGSLIILAPVIGSFLGVIIRRLPDSHAFTWSRSQCEACHAVLKPRDLLPVISWIALRGRCRRCDHFIGWFYPGVEIAALVIVVVALAVDMMPRVWLDCLLGWWLLTLGWIDVRRGVLPDILTLPLIIAGLLTAVLFDPEGLLNRLLGAALGYLALRTIAMGYRVLRGWEGLGSGDAKLLAASGAWVGMLALPQLILVAATTALLAAAVLHLSGTRLHARSALPFGPFLGVATWTIWLMVIGVPS
jgi:leader peptidase (prepilin peptidase) / N-methyltransferase